MCMRYFTFAIIALAILVAFVSLFLSRDNMVIMMYMQQFFQVSIPILGFGALVKYLCSCNK